MYEPSRLPSSRQLDTGKRKCLQRPQGARDPRPGIIRQVEGRDRLVYVPSCPRVTTTCATQASWSSGVPSPLGGLRQALLRALRHRGSRRGSRYSGRRPARRRRAPWRAATAQRSFLYVRALASLASLSACSSSVTLMRRAARRHRNSGYTIHESSLGGDRIRTSVGIANGFQPVPLPPGTPRRVIEFIGLTSEAGGHLLVEGFEGRHRAHEDGQLGDLAVGVQLEEVDALELAVADAGLEAQGDGVALASSSV